MRNLKHIVLAALLAVSSSAYAHAGDISGGFTATVTANSAGKTGDISGGKTEEVSGSFYGDISGGFVDFLIFVTVGL
jgi:hypothetical protein